MMGFVVAAYAQRPNYPPFNGSVLDLPMTVRTDEVPCRQYTPLGSTVSIWDWRTPTFTVYYYPDNATTYSERVVASPFHGYFTNTAHLAIHPGEDNDYEPADGWELLYHDLGSSDFPVEEPSFGLYNRLDGRIRVFFYLEPNDGSAPDNVFINLGHVVIRNSTLTKVSGLFENLNIPANALENFDQSVAGGTAQLNLGEAGSTWYMLETFASYDPCICQHHSGLLTRPLLTDIETLLFEIEGTGVSQTLNAPGSSSGSYIGNALGFANNLTGTVSSGYKIIKDINDFEGLSNQTGLVRLIQDVLPDWFPAAAFGAKILGFIAGKPMSTGAPRLVGYNHNFNFTGDGMIVDSARYRPFFFYTPGSFFDYDRLIADRPVYDNPLGLFTVLEEPVVELSESNTWIDSGVEGFYHREVRRFKYKGDLKYHINTVAGLGGTPIRLMGALVWPNNCRGEGGSFEGDAFVSPAINLTCLEDYVVDFYRVEERVWNPQYSELETILDEQKCYGDPELQVVALLSAAGAGGQDEILFSARYKTKVEYVAPDIEWPNPFKGLTADEIFEVCDPAVDPPVSDDDLIKLCRGKYNPSTNGRSQGAIVLPPLPSGEVLREATPEVAVFPNPFQDKFTINIPEDWLHQPLALVITDMLGRTVWSVQTSFESTGNHSFGNNLAQLPSGMYSLQVTGNDFATTIAVQKQ